MSERFKPPDTEESVACNLIPMIDIMFLLLLFFMLGADMTAHELEDVELPKADQVKEDDVDDPTGPKRTNVNVFHVHNAKGYTCEVKEGGGVCRDMTHWAIAIRASHFTIETLGPELAELAALDPEESTGGPKAGKPLSKREIMIRGDRNAPYGYIQGVIEQCAAAGLYKIAVSAARPEGS